MVSGNAILKNKGRTYRAVGIRRVASRKCERLPVGGEGSVEGEGSAKRKSRWTRSTMRSMAILMVKRTARSTATKWRYRME